MAVTYVQYEFEIIRENVLFVNTPPLPERTIKRAGPKNNDDVPGASQHPPSLATGINARSTCRLEFRIKPTGKEQKEEPVHSL